MRQVKRQYRLSYSSLGLFHACPRAYQLEKMLANEEPITQESPSLIFGKAYGVGVQDYLMYQDSEKALYEAWKAFSPEVDDPAKDMHRCLATVQGAFPRIDDLLMEYSLYHRDGKPATEFSFKVTLSEDAYYVGYIDAVLQRRTDGVLIPLDFKHTGSNRRNLDPFYKNSSQVMGYGVVMDHMQANPADTTKIIYHVAKLVQPWPSVEYQTLYYTKTLADKLQWLLSLYLGYEEWSRCRELGVWPLRGSGCLRFNRECKYFGVCNMYSADIPLSEYLETEEEITEQEKQYDVEVAIDPLIEYHYELLER